MRPRTVPTTFQQHVNKGCNKLDNFPELEQRRGYWHLSQGSSQARNGVEH